MTKDQVLKILDLKKTKTTKEIANLMDISSNTVSYWLREARKQGIKTPPPQKAGRKTLILK